MLSYGGFGAWIEIEGTQAEEYAVEVDENNPDGPIVSCWIASEIDKRFTINHKSEDTSFMRANDFAGISNVDGEWVGTYILRRTRRLPSTEKRVGIQENASAIRPFVFSGLQTTDEETLPYSASTDLGEIQVKIRPIRLTGATELLTFNTSALKGQTVHERMKKAVDQHVTAGAPIAQATLTDVPSFSCLGISTVRFIFRYRARDVLVANGLAPRASSSTADGTPKTGLKRLRDSGVEDAKPDVDISSDTDEELRSLEAEVARRRSNKNKKQRVKKEPEVEVPPSLKGTVIDLTEDD